MKRVKFFGLGFSVLALIGVISYLGLMSVPEVSIAKPTDDAKGRYVEKVDAGIWYWHQTGKPSHIKKVNSKCDDGFCRCGWKDDEEKYWGSIEWDLVEEEGTQCKFTVDGECNGFCYYKGIKPDGTICKDTLPNGKEVIPHARIPCNDETGTCTCKHPNDFNPPLTGLFPAHLQCVADPNYVPYDKKEGDGEGVLDEVDCYANDSCGSCFREKPTDELWYEFECLTAS